MKDVLARGTFENIHSRDVRSLEEAARFGQVYVALWSDEVEKRITGSWPKFPEQERMYLLEAIRFVHKIQNMDQLARLDELPWHTFERDQKLKIMKNGG